MRNLAKSLGFEVMSLYNHVPNKAGMLEAMVDEVAGQIEEPDNTLGWKLALRNNALSAHELLLAHPWAGGLWNTSGGPNRLEYMEGVLRTFRKAGFSVSLTDQGFHSLTMYVVGFTLQRLSFGFTAEELDELANTFLRELPEAEYPYMAEHVRWHLDDNYQAGTFGFVLDLILDGLEAAFIAEQL
jgi:AcrR family transcriptional regulator